MVRDAEIALRQGETAASNDNVGFVPTLHLFARRPLSEQWAFRAEFDGLAGGPGRLFDIALKVDYAMNDRLEVGIGYRTLEGGADVDEVYNFAWLNYATAELRYRF